MQALIDAEVYLYRAAASCEYEIEWDQDEWTYTCRHAEAKTAWHLARLLGKLGP